MKNLASSREAKDKEVSGIQITSSGTRWRIILKSLACILLKSWIKTDVSHQSMYI